MSWLLSFGSLVWAIRHCCSNYGRFISILSSEKSLLLKFGVTHKQKAWQNVKITSLSYLTLNQNVRVSILTLPQVMSFALILFFIALYSLGQAKLDFSFFKMSQFVWQKNKWMIASFTFPSYWGIAKGFWSIKNNLLLFVHHGHQFNTFI